MLNPLNVNPGSTSGISCAHKDNDEFSVPLTANTGIYQKFPTLVITVLVMPANLKGDLLEPCQQEIQGKG